VIGGVTKTTDYIGGIEYDNSSTTIGFIQTEEGKAVPNGTTNYDYNYYLGDNLGNTRVTFGTKTGAAILYQQDDYYPFGLEINRTPFTPKNEYLYNKKELQEDFTEYDYGARFYDPVVVHWNTIDPMAEYSRRWSTYNYVEDNPIRLIDPDGMKPDSTAAQNQAFDERINAMKDAFNKAKDEHADYTNSSNGDPAENPSNEEASNSTKQQDYIIYTGQKALWVSNGQASIYDEYAATSGDNEDPRNDWQYSNWQNQKDAGPIPEGDYSVNLKPDPDRIAKIDKNPQFLDQNPQGGIEKIPTSKVWDYQGAWGTMRAHLDPKPGTNTLGREEGTFYLHNSHKGYTHGCIEVANSLFTRLLDYRKTHAAINVFVRYKSATTSTHGNTAY
jgi:RHS repeat-associated protein